jgi:PKD repeat protein
VGGFYSNNVFKITPANLPPVAVAGGPYTGDEGSEVTFDGTGSSDPDDDALTYAWNFGDGVTGSDATPTHTYADNGEYEVCLTVTDPQGLSDTQCTVAEVANVAPNVGPIDGPMDPIQLGTSIILYAEFIDPGMADTHSAQWNWGDGSIEAGTLDQGAGSGSVEDSHDYSEAGICTVRLTVTDNDGGSAECEFRYVVVYDPAGGFVTGGGWIVSPVNEDYQYMTVRGKANFGFVSKYKKGASVPTGQTEFVFQAGDLNFHSSSYEWLVVNQNGTNAQFKGSGTINGAGDYKFMLWAGDGEPDTFRIKIWTESDGVETIVYDNGVEQAISGGSIAVHTK